MLKTFALIALLHGQAYEVDSGLTIEDCRYAVQGGVSMVEIEQGVFVAASDAELFCEAE